MKKKWDKSQKIRVRCKKLGLIVVLILCGIYIINHKSSDTKHIEIKNIIEDKYDIQENIEIDEMPYVIPDFEIIYQNPELPTGCEITALTMLLNHYGYQVDKTIMASEYLPTTAYYTYYGSDGRMYGPDLENYFVGDPFSELGTVCGAGAVVVAANRYLEESGSTMCAKNITGCSPQWLYQYVSKGNPVLVLVTIGMEDRYSTIGWYTENGDYVDWSTNDHGSVLIGWDEDEVTIACPILGIETYSREQFEKVFIERGSKAVVLCK